MKCVGALLGCLVSTACASPSAPRVAPAKNEPIRVALTFDDLPAHAELPPGVTRLDVIRSILATLAAHHVPPTYGFVNGSKVKAHPEDGEVLRAWVAAGHPLGNHGYSHLSLDEKADVDAYLRDLDDNEETLRAFSPPGTPERAWKVYRYPYLQEGTSKDIHEKVRTHLQTRGYRIAEVSVDFGDWAWNPAYARCQAKGDAPAIAALETSYVQDAKTFLRWSSGAAKQVLGRDAAHVLLLHVGAFDARALDAMLTAYEKMGVTFVALDQAMVDPIYAMDTGYFGKWGEGVFEQLADGKGTVTLPMPLMPLALLEGMCR